MKSYSRSDYNFEIIDKEEQTAILYQRQERYQDAEKIWEHRNMYEVVTRQFCFPEWMRYNAHLQLALVKKDKDKSLSVLQKMLPAMRKEWNEHFFVAVRNLKNSWHN